MAGSLTSDGPAAGTVELGQQCAKRARRRRVVLGGARAGREAKTAGDATAQGTTAKSAAASPKAGDERRQLCAKHTGRCGVVLGGARASREAKAAGDATAQGATAKSAAARPKSTGAAVGSTPARSWATSRIQATPRRFGLSAS